MLVIIANNRGYYIDEQHQAVTSKARKRPSTRPPGSASASRDPDVDMTAHRAGAGLRQRPAPVASARAISATAVRRGVEAVERGACYFIDVRIAPDYVGFPH